MKHIVWLASYPKSGNTWMRVFLTNYQKNAETPANINELDRALIASARFWFDEWAGVEASDLSDMTIERLRPEIYRCIARDAPPPWFMKVHDAWKRTDQGQALFPDDATAGVVYILRNPLDLAPSAASHWGISVPEAVDRMCNSEFALARSFEGLNDQLRQWMGSWSDHVRSWVDESGLRVLVVRYEDMLRDPQTTFGEVVRFAGLPFEAERLRLAIAHSDFEVLRGQEEQHGFKERSFVSQQPFFRRGQVGSWRDELGENLVGLLIARHGEMMRRFGYLDETGSPLV